MGKGGGREEGEVGQADPYARSDPRDPRAEDRSSGLMRPGDHDDFADSANSRSPANTRRRFPSSISDRLFSLHILHTFFFFSLSLGRGSRWRAVMAYFMRDLLEKSMTRSNHRFGYHCGWHWTSRVLQI